MENYNAVRDDRCAALHRGLHRVKLDADNFARCSTDIPRRQQGLSQDDLHADEKLEKPWHSP